MKKNITLWFTRSKGIVKGPFTASVIRNNQLLGRLDPTQDKVSTDQVNWHIINTQLPLSIDYNIEAAIKSKHNLDERNGFDRRHPIDNEQVTPKNRITNRRESEEKQDIQRRQFRTLLMQKFRDRKEHIFWPLITLFVILVILSILAISYSKPFPTTQVNCRDPASSGVNWSNCLKPQSNLENVVLIDAQLRNSQLVGSNLMNATLSGADLAYSDLRFVNLSYSQMNNALLLGANLKNADLSYADLSNANFSYADLTNAKIGGSKLDNARFDHAIWVDGQICAEGSIGKCIILDAQTP